MAINIKNLQERVQKKVASISPSTPSADLNRIVEASTLALGSVRQFDSAGALPSVVATQAQIAYSKKDNAIYHKSDGTTTWKTLTTNAYVAGPSAPAPTSQPYQGDTYGFYSGGVNPGDAPNPGSGGPTAAYNLIDRYAFASATNATDYGDLTDYRQEVTGQSSSTHGYTSGGAGGSGAPQTSNVIDKFPFTAAGNATDVGDTTVARYGVSGSQSSTHGYTHGGSTAPGTAQNVVDKFSFGSDGNATDVGDLTLARTRLSGCSSNDHGYAAGGTPATGKRIDKYAFASDGNATDVGDTLAEFEYLGDCPSSPTHGYVVGGFNTMEKFSFSVDGNSTDVGDLLVSVTRGYAGANSEPHGFIAGGYNPTGYSNVIQKYSHTADENSTDVADLNYSSQYGAGQQV